MSAPALHVTDLGFAYGAERVLDEVAFSLPAGIGALIGPSGCGKTTLLMVVAGLIEPNAGLVSHAFRRPAMVFQEPCLLPWRRARDNAAFGLKAAGLPRAERARRTAALLEAVGLSAADGRKYPNQLSGGMRQRVALVRALAIDPDLLLLDEPFGSLDVGTRRQMQTRVHDLIATRTLTALMATHDLAEAVRMADRVFVLTPKPATIAAVHDIVVPFAARDAGFVHAEVGRLLARPEIARALAL